MSWNLTRLAVMISVALTSITTAGCGPDNEEQLYQIGKDHSITEFVLTFHDGSSYAFTKTESEELTDFWHTPANINHQYLIHIEQKGTDANYQMKLSNDFEMEYEAFLLKENGRHYLSLLLWDDGGGFQADVWSRVLELDNVLDADRLNELYELSASQ